MITKTIEAGRLAIRSIVFAVALLFPVAWAADWDAFSIKLQGGSEVLRLMLNARVGILEGAHFDEDGKSFVIDFRSAERGRLEQLLAEQQPEHPLLKELKVIPHGEHSVSLKFTLVRPLEVLDETVVATGEDSSAWEVVLGPRMETAHNELADGVPIIEAKEEDGLIDLAFLSKEKLQAEVFLMHDPERVVVDITGMPQEQLEKAVAEFASFTPLVKGLRFSKTQRNVTRIVFDLGERVTLVSKSGMSGAEGENFWVTIGTEQQIALREKRLAETRLARAETAEPGATPAAPSMPQTGRAAPGSMAIRGASRLPSELAIKLRQEDFVGEGQAEPTPLDPVMLGEAGKSRDRMAAVATSKPGAEEIGLFSFFERALNSDPKYLAAKADYQANAESYPQAIAGYLPTAAYDYQRSNVRQDVKQSSNPVYALGVQNYSSTTGTLTITQPIIKAQAFAKINQAKVAAEQAKVNLVAAEQDLIVRATGAYLNLAAARDALALARAEREVTEKQYQLAEERLKSGLGTILDSSETAGRLALAEAREIEAQNKLDDARLAIKEIIGADMGVLPGFKRDFEAKSPLPASIESWVEAALDQNLALQSRSMALDIATMEVGRQKAGYLPTLNLVGTSTGQDSSGSLYGGGSKVNTRDITLKLNVPLFEGGMTNSLVREAKARKDKAQQERDMEFRHTERLARSSYFSVVSSAKSIEALRKMVIAQEHSLQSKIKGFRSGLFTIVSVVDAYRLYYAAKRDYLQVRYDYLMNRLKLKQAVGSLGRKDLEDISYLFY